MIKIRLTDDEAYKYADFLFKVRGRVDLDEKSEEKFIDRISSARWYVYHYLGKDSGQRWFMSIKGLRGLYYELYKSDMDYLDDESKRKIKDNYDKICFYREPMEGYAEL